MKKVLIFSREFPPFVGGAGTVAFEYARTLGDLFEVTVLTESIQGRNNIRDGFDNFKIEEMKSSFCLPGVLKFYRFRQFYDFDLIILNDSSSIFYAGVFFSKKLLSRCVCIYHGSEPENIYENPSRVRKMINYKGFFSRASKLSKNNFTVSQYMKTKMESVFELSGVDFDVLYTPLTIDKYKVKKSLTAEHKRLFELLIKKKIYITASRIVEKKGHNHLLSAFENVLSKGVDDWHWIIVGDGPYLDEFKGIVKSSKVNKSVSFLGAVERDYLSLLYSKSYCMALLSDYKESFGLVYIEANLQGIPVVGFNRYGAIEAISNNHSGFLVDNPNQFSDLVINDKFKELKVSNIKAHANLFDSNKFIDKIIELTN